jgi:hypothetical protein
VLYPRLWRRPGRGPLEGGLSSLEPAWQAPVSRPRGPWALIARPPHTSRSPFQQIARLALEGGTQLVESPMVQPLEGGAERSDVVVTERSHMLHLPLEFSNSSATQVGGRVGSKSSLKLSLPVAGEGGTAGLRIPRSRPIPR